jgi:DNA-directed RNA polymerase II subunit RPB2
MASKGWRLLDKYFSSHNFITAHHIDSFDDFVRHRLLQTVRTVPIAFTRSDESGNVKHRVVVKVGGPDAKDVRLTKPVFVSDGRVRALYPNDARLRNLNYVSDVVADVHIEYVTGEASKTVVFKDVRIGSVPILLGSCLCVTSGMSPDVLVEMGESPYDQGGYFIVGGREKVIVGQERLAVNRVLLNTSEVGDGKFAVEAMVVGLTEDDTFEKLVHFRVYSGAKTNGRRQNCVVIGMRDISEEVPLFTMFRLIGVESDRRILEHIVGDVKDPKNAEMLDFLRASVIDSNVYTRADALEQFKESVSYQHVDHVKRIVAEDFLRNTANDARKKAVFLGHVVNKIVRIAMGDVRTKTRDSFMNKRVSCTGELMHLLFRDSYNLLRRHIRDKIEFAYIAGGWAQQDDISGLVKESDMTGVVDASIIDDFFMSSLRGNWAKRNDPTESGIVQDLNRISYMGYVSHCMRFGTQGGDIKLAAPRRLDGSQWGVACPVQSPDGAGIGLDKHLAAVAQVTIATDSAAIARCLVDLGVVELSEVGVVTLRNSTRVFLNNDIFGVTADPSKLTNALRDFRRRGVVHRHVSVSWDRRAGEVSVFCESGRIVRPLIVLRNGVMPSLPEVGRWDELFGPRNDGGYAPKGAEAADVKAADDAADEKAAADDAAVLEYIDVEESNDALIAMWPADIEANPNVRYTHCEIHPSTALSLYTNTIPFAHHNQAPRNVFSGQQGKQAIGVYATNFDSRMDTLSYVLHYPQRPLVTTRYSIYSNNDSLPNGENLIVAIATFTGYNQEDAVILNRQSCERGMFNVTYLKSFIDQEEVNRSKGVQTMFANPHELSRRGLPVKAKFANEMTADENGLPNINAQVEQGDLLLGKVSVSVDANTDGTKRVQYRDVSYVADKTIDGTVDKVVIFKDEAGERFAKVRLRNIRLPQLGDKCASRHGQKGVVGAILDSWDMPFTASGIVPDIIINPHAIPSRMTVGHLMECVVAKACVLGGRRADASAFDRHDLDSFCNELSEAGLQRYGDEVMYDGRSGEQVAAPIFIGPTFYFRLKHMAADKINFRSTGPVSATTRQPVRGRSIDGGLRLGEMERDAMLANGVSGFLREAFVEKSDAYNMAIDDDGRAQSDGSKRARVPFPLKLFLQEAFCLGVDTKLST